MKRDIYYLQFKIWIIPIWLPYACCGNEVELLELHENRKHPKYLN